MYGGEKIIAEFIEPHNTKWKQALWSCLHDFYHYPEYIELACRHEGGSPIAFYAEKGENLLLAPLLIRKVPTFLGAPEYWCDVTVPYGYPTPITAAPKDLDSIEMFLKSFQELGVKQGIISAFFRLHPLISLPSEVLIKHGELVEHGETIYIDLNQSFDEIWQQTRQGHRYDIKKLQKLGYRVEVDDWSFFESFITIYMETMMRVLASDFYFFSQDYFRELRTALNKNLHLCTVLSPNGEVAAAGLFSTCNGIVQYHLSGTSESYHHLAPTKLMLDFMRRWAKENGNRYFHLGGGVGGKSDSLFKFKAGFSKLRAKFYTYRMILDNDRYETLVYQWRMCCNNVEQINTDFFPIYRKPCDK